MTVREFQGLLGGQHATEVSPEFITRSPTQDPRNGATISTRGRPANEASRDHAALDPQHWRNGMCERVFPPTSARDNRSDWFEVPRCDGG
jgi:hypothetical protein